MSGETEKDISGWTTDTLREYFSRVIDERDHRYQETINTLRRETEAARLQDASRLSDLRDADDTRYLERAAASEKAINAALAAAKEAVNAALVAAKEAVTVAENNSEKWRTNANEWRGAMNDREVEFIRRAQYESDQTNVRVSLKELAVRTDGAVSELKGRLDLSQGRGVGLGAGWGYLVGAIGVLALLIEIFFRFGK